MHSDSWSGGITADRIIDERSQLVFYLKFNGDYNEVVLAECLRCGSCFSDRKALAERRCLKCEGINGDEHLPEVRQQHQNHISRLSVVREQGRRDDLSPSGGEQVIATSILTVPALPDEATVLREIQGRPDWQMITETLEGANGKELYAMGSEGAQAIEDLTHLDTCLKVYLPEFQRQYWASALGLAKKAIDERDAEVRLVEERRIKEARKRIGEINGEFLLERDRAIEAEKRRLEEKQRCVAEEERKKLLLALEAEQLRTAAEQVDEIAQEIEEVKAAPVVPVTVSKAQAAAGLPSAPAKVSAKKTYVRRISNVKEFLKWLAEHPDYAATLGLSVTFAKLKNNAMVIPGVTVEEKFETSNRGR